MKKLPIVSGRSCKDCTKCCEGYLSANIRGYEMKPGTKCFFVEQGVGCTEYKSRPFDPCKTFSCDWLHYEEIPEEFKPNLSNMIFTSRTINSIPFVQIVQAGDEFNSEVLSWSVVNLFPKGSNFSWNIGEKEWFIGSNEFCNEMNKKNQIMVDLK